MDNKMNTELRFLLIEDDPDHADLIRFEFERYMSENQMTHVSDGEMALNFLFKKGEFKDALSPDVIILDLNLPKIGGHEVLSKVKNDPELKQIPVVVLSTSDSTSDRQKAYNLGVNSYVTKPVGFDKFQEALKEIQLYWGNRNEPPQ